VTDAREPRAWMRDLESGLLNLEAAHPLVVNLAFAAPLSFLLYRSPSGALGALVYAGITVSVRICWWRPGGRLDRRFRERGGTGGRGS
jgi:hypothetical protein